MKELTKGSPAKLIFLFTMPLLVGNLFQQFYLMADTLIVGRTLGVNALAAVGSTGSISFLMIGFAQGLTAGLSILVAQRFGAQDFKGVRRSFATSIWISLVVAILLTIISVGFVRQILILMQTPPEIIKDAQAFIVVLFAGIGVTVFFNLLSNVIRALGDSRTPLLFLVVASVINVVLDLVFILKFNMGVAGAAYATLTAQICSTIFCIIYIRRKIPVLYLRRKDLKVDWSDVKAHLNVGLPMAFQASIIAIGAIVLQSALNSLGATSVAAYTAAGKIDQLATQPMMSFGITMATFTAQNYGAKEYKRILTGVKQCVIMSGSFSIVAGAIIILFGKQLVSLFVGNQAPEVLALSQTYFNIVGSCYVVLSVLFIVRYTLQGLGQSVIPTVAGIAELLMRSFAAIFLAHLFGFTGACWASPLAWMGSVLVLVASYVGAVRKLKRLDAEKSLNLES